MELYNRQLVDGLYADNAIKPQCLKGNVGDGRVLMAANVSENRLGPESIDHDIVGEDVLNDLVSDIEDHGLPPPDGALHHEGSESIIPEGINIEIDAE
jgi:hypothetical protein